MADKKLTKEEVLAQLKKEGINSLEDLAAKAETQAQSSATDSWIIHPHYFINH